LSESALVRHSRGRRFRGRRIEEVTEGLVHGHVGRCHSRRRLKEAAARQALLFGEIVRERKKPRL
jgi:hypothetical protein